MLSAITQNFVRVVGSVSFQMTAGKNEIAVRALPERAATKEVNFLLQQELDLGSAKIPIT